MTSTERENKIKQSTPGSSLKAIIIIIIILFGNQIRDVPDRRILWVRSRDRTLNVLVSENHNQSCTKNKQKKKGKGSAPSKINNKNQIYKANQLLVVFGPFTKKFRGLRNPPQRRSGGVGGEAFLIKEKPVQHSFNIAGFVPFAGIDRTGTKAKK